MQALMAKLEESAAAAAPSPPAIPVAQAACAASAAPAEPNWHEFASGADDQETARRSLAAQARPHVSTLNRLAPLAMWARAEEQMEYRIEDILPGASPTSAASPTAGLRLPDEVAGVRYGSGARIRHVRVAPAAKPPAPGGKRQVVILSKKILDEQR